MPPLDQLFRQLHMGAELELAGTTLKRWKVDTAEWVLPQYGVMVAETDMSGVGDIANISLQPDHTDTQSKTALIEHVGGPRRVMDQQYEIIFKEAVKTFINVFKDPKQYTNGVTKGGQKVTLLDDLLVSYNEALPKQAVYKKLHLKLRPDVGYEWYVKPAASINPSPQLNFEVPFRNIGRIPELNEANDFARAFKDKKMQSLFKEARVRANALVRDVFLQYSQDALFAEGKMDRNGESAKLEKLKSLFTLHYYLRGMEQSRNSLTKDTFELLPKAAPNDLIRTALSSRDRRLLAYVTARPARFLLLQERMDADILKVIRKANPSTAALNNRETLHLNHRRVFEPGYSSRYSLEVRSMRDGTVTSTLPENSTAYGNALTVGLASNQWKDGADSYSGKPLQVLHYPYDKDGGIKQEPVIVFESRGSEHPFSQLAAASVAQAFLDKRKFQLIAKLENANRNLLKDIQKPFLNRPAKPLL